MMNWYEIIFFNIFKKYYKNGRYKNDIPWLTATGIVVCSTFFNLFSITIVVHELLNPEKEFILINKSLYMLIFSVFYLVNYLFFIYQKRYLIIFEKYKKSKYDTKFFTIISFGYSILSFLIFIIVVFKYRR